MLRADIPLIGGLLIASTAFLAASLFLGPVFIPPKDVLGGLFGDDVNGLIVREIRAPRAIAAWIAGACLGAAGAALQGLLRNPLADPGVLGVSAAASLGAVIALYFNLAAFALWVLPLSAIAAACAATAVLYALGGAQLSTARLILVGVGLSAFCGAMTSLAMNLSPNPFALSDLINWLFGSVANRSFADIALALPFAIVGVALITVGAPALTALSLGEETAASLGANIARSRVFIIIGTAFLVGASVAIAGAIGFVGIIAPHLLRPFVGHDPARLILPSALLGGALLAFADIAIRLAPFDQELKLGVAAALIGAPGFVYVAATTKRIAT